MYRNVTISCRTQYIYNLGLKATYNVSESWQKRYDSNVLYKKKKTMNGILNNRVKYDLHTNCLLSIYYLISVYAKHSGYTMFMHIESRILNETYLKSPIFTP